MNLMQGPGIRWRLLRDDSGPEIANSFELRRKIDRRFPVGNLVGNLAANSFHLAKLGALRREDLLRFLENLQQFAQPHRSNGRQHIERDACFGRVHSKSRKGIGAIDLNRLYAVR